MALPDTTPIGEVRCASTRDRTIAALHADFVQARRQPIVERLAVAAAEGQLAPEADPELVVDLLSGPIFYRHLIGRTRTSDADVAAMVATVLASARPAN
jgi:Tetracyclin repressor-like, C-terminal domain